MEVVRNFASSARGRWVLVLGATTAFGVVCWSTGLSPWPLVVVVIVVTTLLIGQWSSWPFAFAGSFIVILALFSVLLRIAPWSGLPLSISMGGALLLGAVGAIVALARVRVPRLPTRREVLVVAPAIAVPVVIVVVGGPIAAALGSGPTWAMRNDAVWNLVTARLIIDDGGLRVDQHPNSSPLTGGLIATAASPGRSAIGPTDLLEHDASSAAELWLLVVLAGAALAGLVGLRTTHSATRALRITAAVATAVIPVTWFVVGFAFQFGFYNSSIAVLLLLASWLAWLETRVAPILGSAMLSLATVAMLATWAPLAAIPGALAIVALASRLSSRRREGRRTGLWWVIAAAPVPIYVAVVTLPDLRRDGAALAVEGGIQPLAPTHVLLVIAAASVIVVFHALRARSPHLLIGYGVVVASGVLGIGYLVWQRLQSTTYWGYYPIKMSWMLCSLLLVILTAALLAEVAAFRGRRGASLLAVGSSGLLVAALMAQTPPIESHPLPFVDIVAGTGVAYSPADAKTLFDVSEDGQRVLASRLVDQRTDGFLNLWLLQLESDSAQDPIRGFAYVLDSSDAGQVCEAIRTWGGDVEVKTSDAGLDDDLRAICAEAEFRVVVQ